LNPKETDNLTLKKVHRNIVGHFGKHEKNIVKCKWSIMEFHDKHKWSVDEVSNERIKCCQALWCTRSKYTRQ